MKNFILTLSLVCSISCTFSQDTVRLVHKNYTTVYSKTNNYPVLVEWWLTKKKLTCPNPLPRVDKFTPDPLLKENTNLQSSYTKSGFDRGHMSPAADNQCLTDTVLLESFYFSNMSPQYHSLNAGDWKSLEVYSRNLSISVDSVKVFCGNIGQQMKIGIVSVPELCWKVIYIKKTKKFHYFIFKNDKSKPDGYQNNEVSKAEFEKVVKIKIKP